MAQTKIEVGNEQAVKHLLEHIADKLELGIPRIVRAVEHSGEKASITIKVEIVPDSKNPEQKIVTLQDSYSTKGRKHVGVATIEPDPEGPQLNLFGDLQ